MVRIKIRAHVYETSMNGRQNKIKIVPRQGIQVSTLPYSIQHPAIAAIPVFSKAVNWYLDAPCFENIVISGDSSFFAESNTNNRRIGRDSKMDILSKYISIFAQTNIAILIISGQGSNSVSAYDVYKPLISSQNNRFYTPLDCEKMTSILAKEYNEYCNINHSLSRNSSMLKYLLKLLSIEKRDVIDAPYNSVEEFESALDDTLNRQLLTIDYVNQVKQTLRSRSSSFEPAMDFIGQYYSTLEDVLYPIVGSVDGYNTSKLNSGIAFQLKIRPMSSITENTEDVKYNQYLSNLLMADLKNNFNQDPNSVSNIVVILDNLSFEQAEIFSWIWKRDDVWLHHNEYLSFICLQENYTKQMMKCDGFDAKIEKWYYLNHNDGSDLEHLFGEKRIYDVATEQHTDYGGLFSFNRLLKIPSGEGKRLVPTYRPKYEKTFFQDLRKGEGLLKVRGEQVAHEFKCILD